MDINIDTKKMKENAEKMNMLISEVISNYDNLNNWINDSKDKFGSGTSINNCVQQLSNDIILDKKNIYSLMDYSKYLIEKAEYIENFLESVKR